MALEQMEGNSAQEQTEKQCPKWVCALVICFGFLFSLWGVFHLGVPGNRSDDAEGKLALMDKYDMYITNQISEALDGVLAIEKRYWLNDYDMIAPEPEKNCYGKTANPADMEPVLAEAARLLGIETFVFSTDKVLRPDSEITWYLDETIFAVTWQEIKDGSVYTLSEVKIAHASQFRRFLAGGTYGYDKQFLTTQMSADVNAVVACSGDFYKYRGYGIVVYNGKAYRAEPNLDTCFIDDKGDLLLVKARELKTMEAVQAYVDENHIRFSLSFGPVLIRDGVRCDPYDYIVGEIDENYPRAALCQVEQLHYLMVVANSTPEYYHLPSMREFARRLEEMDVQTAYALDGGQTGVIVMDDQMISPVQYGSQRQISDIIYFSTALPDGG
jgi:hypothetical protein